MNLPAHDRHQAAGATFAERFGWTIPLDYGDPNAEALAVRRGAGLADRSDRGKIRLEGPDRVAFLQAIVSNDVAAIEPGLGRYTLGLNHKGQIVAEFPMLPWDESLLLHVEPEERAFTVGWLRRYKLRSKVQIADETEALALLSLAGPSSPGVLAAWLGERIVLDQDAVAEREWRGQPVLLAGARDTGELGYDVFLPASVAGEACDAFTTMGAPPIGRLAWEILRVEAGTPRYGPELNESTLPPEAKLEERAISYEKGCYPGQEIVARIKNRGHVNRLLRGLTLDVGDPPAAGTLVRTPEREVGAVTSAVWSPTLERPIALAYVRREISPGQTVSLADGRAAMVVDPPFVGVREVA
jgi:folate-binding protein YgfZ